MNNELNNKFFIISHRGASYYEPENTIRAFSKAVELGSNMIEFDVRKTLDDELVIIHDKTINRTTNGEGLVKAKTLSELRAFDAGRGENIPLFEEVIKSFKDKVSFVIELKEELIEKQILEIVYKYNLSEKVFFVSFKKSCLKKIRALDSSVLTGLITVTGYDFINGALECGCNAVASNHLFATLSKVKKVHEKELMYFCWTVNSRKKGEKLRTMGVDGIITDRPNLYL